MLFDFVKVKLYIMDFIVVINYFLKNVFLYFSRKRFFLGRRVNIVRFVVVVSIFCRLILLFYRLC